jgi:hypothetical protein
MISSELLCKKIEDVSVLCTKSPKRLRDLLIVLFKFVALFLIMGAIIKVSYDNSIGLFFTKTANNEEEKTYNQMDYSTALFVILIYGLTREGFTFLGKLLREMEVGEWLKKLKSR